MRFELRLFGHFGGRARDGESEEAEAGLFAVAADDGGVVDVLPVRPQQVRRVLVRRVTAEVVVRVLPKRVRVEQTRRDDAEEQAARDERLGALRAIVWVRGVADDDDARRRLVAFVGAEVPRGVPLPRLPHVPAVRRVGLQLAEAVVTVRGVHQRAVEATAN